MSFPSGLSDPVYESFTLQGSWTYSQISFCGNQLSKTVPLENEPKALTLHSLPLIELYIKVCNVEANKKSEYEIL